MRQRETELGVRGSKGLEAFTSDVFYSQDTQTSGCAVLSLLLLPLPASVMSAAGADPLSDLSGADAWPAMVLLKRRMLICRSSLSTTGVVGSCLDRP